MPSQTLPNRTIETAGAGPIIGKGPVTDNPTINMALGAGVVGASQAGFLAVTGGGQVLATSLSLNLLAQLVKDVKWFPEHKGLIVLMLAISFLIGYFIFYNTGAVDDPARLANSFMNMANSTMQAILNYKGDKAAGINALEPTPAEKEFTYMAGLG